jgi:hypothetical protein
MVSDLWDKMLFFALKNFAAIVESTYLEKVIYLMYITFLRIIFPCPFHLSNLCEIESNFVKSQVFSLLTLTRFATIISRKREINFKSAGEVA